MRTVFVDTSALLPLMDRSDGDHQTVVKAVEKLAGEQALLVTASYTLVEAAALVRSRLGQAAFRALGNAVDESMDIVWVDEDLHRRAWTKVSAQTRKGPSLVDWVSFLVMKELGIDAALTLDDHFRRQGFSTIPQTISSSQHPTTQSQQDGQETS